MKRVIGSFALFGLLLTACGGGVAATVDGVSITVGDVGALASNSAPDSAQFASTLNNLILNTVATKAAEDEFGIEVTREDLDGQIALISAEIEAQGSTLDLIKEENQITDEFVDLFANQEVISDKVTEALRENLDPISDEEVRTAYDAELLAYEEQIAAQSEAYELQLKFAGMEACSSHILLETEEDANGALARLEGGEAFADLAVELSTGPSGPTGGDLGCGSPGQFVPAFAEAVGDGEIGVPIGPVETEFGFHVILVTSRTIDDTVEPPVEPEIPDFPTFEEVQPDILTNLEDEALGTAFQDWISGVLRAADVTVSEEFGTWSVPDDELLLPQVLPPVAE